jgi:type VI secretion system secreted protein VgrG
MNATLVQEKRIAILTTPLGEDVLVLSRFDGHEGLGELFEYRIEALSDQEDVDFDQVLGQACSVKFATYGNTRYFNGILVEAQWLGASGVYYAHRLILRPWFWLLTRTTDCRIFENMSVLDIIKKVFSDRGFSDFSDKTTNGYPQIEYCVQYRETDFNFICRMMEKYGIYYYFEHSDSKHMLVMCDSKSSHSPVPGLASFPFIALAGADRRDEEHVYDWSTDRRFRTGKIELNDYDYTHPNASLIADAKGSAKYTKSDMEIYDYPGKYTKQGDGEKFAKVWLEAEQAQDQHRYAAGDAISLFPGGLATLERHWKGSENVQYLMLRAAHAYVAENYRSGASEPEQIYQGSYEFLPSDRPFRSQIVTPKPLIHGIQTAKVVGQSGEEIDVDDQGRILVQFYWDRKKMQSCRVRIAQVWSGKNWGGIFIPRIDQEVVVEFLEGDPDRPLVTGTVYNGDNQVPYTLPDNKTKGGFKTDSSKGHGGYNEIVFEDKKASEQIGVHAQKDLNLVILNSETREIGANFMVPMGSPSRTTTLKNGDDNLTLSTGSQNIQIQGNQTTNVNMEVSTTAMITMTLTVGLSTITLTPASVSVASPMIDLTAEATISLTAPVINITGVVNITGMVNIVGGLTVDGMVPMLLPA